MQRRFNRFEFGELAETMEGRQSNIKEKKKKSGINMHFDNSFLINNHIILTFHNTSETGKFMSD